MMQVEIVCPCCGEKIVLKIATYNQFVIDNSKFKDIELGDLEGGDINERQYFNIK
jgi:hypothetical protein